MTATVATTATTAPSASSTTVASRNAPHGPFAVTVEDLELTDPSRETSANGRAGAHAGRALPTRLYIPVGPGPFPLFVWSHGLDATVSYFDPLLRDWAARGYVVAAPTFPLTRTGAPGGPRFDDYVNQPADASFVISQVLAQDGPSGTRHRGLVDPSHIGAGGHSLGAVTSLALVANRCCIDARVHAVIVVDGAPLSFPGGAVEQRGIPVLFLHGDADTTFPLSDGRALYMSSRAPKFLVVMHGVPHTAFTVPRVRNVIIPVVGEFLDAYLRRDQSALASLERDAKVPGFTTLEAVP